MRLPRSVICVHRRFEHSWPYTADHWQRCWQASGGCELIRTAAEDAAPARLVPDPASVQRLVLLGFSLGAHGLDPFTALEECYLESAGRLPGGGGRRGRRAACASSRTAPTSTGARR